MLRLTWLGQAGFLIEVEHQRVLVDPWVSTCEGRLIAPPPRELVTTGIDWLVITHEHLDHLDLPFLPWLLEDSPDVHVVLPTPVAPFLAGVVPQDRIVAVQPGDSLDLGPIRTHVVPAFHGVEPADAYGDGSSLGGLPRFVGYVFDSLPTLYHAGDTIVTPELIESLAALTVDVALLPVNGRDAIRESRGIVGNMDAAEAVELALVIGASYLVPYHWDGFEGNTVDPGSVVSHADARLHVVTPARLVPFKLCVDRF